MSFGGGNNTASAAPKIGGLDNSNLSSNEQAVPVPWCSGQGIFPLTWIVPEVYNLVTVKERKKVSKKKVTVGINYYGDVAGIACLGLIDRVTLIESGDKVIWEGNETRNDTQGHRNYWRATIETDLGTFYVYWGRPDQPVDDIMLAALGATNPALAHPAYRRQVLVVAKRYYFGLDSTTVPNTRIRVHRAPRPATGDFPPMIAANDQATRDKAARQGESIIAGAMELLTNETFGAGLPARHFAAEEWQTLSTAVTAKAGLHSPYLDRTRKIREVIKDYLAYFDGYIRIDNGILRPGMFPHNGQVPGLAALLTEHDYEGKPTTTSTAPSRTINEIQVSYRDVDDRLKTRSTNASASDSVQARRAHEPKRVDMPGIIDGSQAADYAARAAAVAAEGTFTGNVELRRSTDGNGDPLKPGDIVRFTYSPFGLDRVVRITQRTDPRTGPPTIKFEAEHGLFAALPPVTVEPRPQPGDRIPYPITKARVYELPEGLLANAENSLSGIAVAFLAMRPRSYYEDMPAMTSLDVMAFDVWDSATGASYDPIGDSQRGWAIRATLSAALPGNDADATVRVTIDPDNIDQDRLTEQSAAAQENDTLLLVIGEEVMSIGTITAAGPDWTLPGCLRARLGSAAEAHAAGKAAWLVYADDVTPLSHKQWKPDTDRRFKLQPRTASDVLELAQAPMFVYHFKPATAAAPVTVTLEPMPAAATVGDMLNVSGEVTAPGGNLASVSVVWMRLGEGDASNGEQTLSTVICSGAQKSNCPIATMAVAMAPGRYKVEIRAVNNAGATTKATSGVVEVDTGEGDNGKGGELVQGSYLLASAEAVERMIASGDVRHHVVEHEYPQTLFIKLEWSFLLLLTGNSTLSLKIVPRKDGLLSSLAYDVYLGLLTGQTTFLLTGSTVIPKVATDSEYDLTLGVESGASIRRMRAHILITGWRGRAPYYGAPSDLPEPNTTVTDIYGGGWVAGTAYIVSTTVTSTIGSIAGARTTLFLYNSSGALLWYSSEREAPTNAGASYQCSWSMVALDPGTYEFKISVVRDPPAHGITRYCGQFVVRAASDPPLIKA